MRTEEESLLIEGVGIQAVAHTGGFAVQVPFSGCFVREKLELGFDAERSTVQRTVSPLPLVQGQGCL